MTIKATCTALLLVISSIFASTSVYAEQQEIILESDEYDLILVPIGDTSYARIVLLPNQTFGTRVDSGKTFNCPINQRNVYLSSLDSDRLFATLIAAKAAESKLVIVVSDVNTTGDECRVIQVGMY
ncbi:MAG: hypothetical protein ACSHXK_08235 [Oceanococcus sp.]